MKDLTPNIGPHLHDIASRGRSARHHPDARPIAGLTREVDGLNRQLEYLAALRGRADHLAGQLATVTETAVALGARRGSNPCPSWPVLPADPQIARQLNELTVLPPTTHASRR